jgi:recombination protein RecR
MASLPAGPEIERLIQLLAKLPGLGPRSARRAALALLKKRETLLEPLGLAMRDAAIAIRNCEVCGNLDTASPCSLCRDPRRNEALLCVVEDVADLWALDGLPCSKANITCWAAHCRRSTASHRKS